MSKAAFDPAIHPAKRLRIMSMACAVSHVEFSFLRDEVAVTDSDLSKQLRALSDLGYVEVERTGGRRGGTTWVTATALGAERFTAHCAALRQIVDGTAASTEP